MNKRNERPFSGGDLFEDTKEHVLAAGRELILAAQGMLKFCKIYVDTSSEARFKPYLAEIITKAKFVADDLARDIVKDLSQKRASEKSTATKKKKKVSKKTHKRK